VKRESEVKRRRWLGTRNDLATMEHDIRCFLGTWPTIASTSSWASADDGMAVGVEKKSVGGIYSGHHPYVRKRQKKKREIISSANSVYSGNKRGVSFAQILKLVVLYPISFLEFER
jgi:hypothetical protein